MSKPVSNAPASMQPWVDATDGQLTQLETDVSRLQSAVGKPIVGVDYVQNAGSSAAFTYGTTQDGSTSVGISNATFVTDAIADKNLSVNGTLLVGDPERVGYVYDAGLGLDVEVPVYQPSFAISGAQSYSNPVTNVTEYTPGAFLANDVLIEGSEIHGSAKGSSLYLELLDKRSGNYGATLIVGMTIQGNGTSLTFQVANNAENLATYVTGSYISMSNCGVYNTQRTVITNAVVNGSNIDITVLTTETTAVTGFVKTIGISYTYPVRQSKVVVRGSYGEYALMDLDGFHVGSNITDLNVEPDRFSATTSLTDGGLTTDGGVIATDLYIVGNSTFIGNTSCRTNLDATGVENGVRLLATTAANAVGGLRPVVDGVENSDDFYYNSSLVTWNSDVSLSTNQRSGLAATQASGAHLSKTGYGVFSVDAADGNPCYLHKFNATGTARMVQFIYNGTSSGVINTTSGGTPAFASGSDYRIKEDVQPVTDALERMKGIQAYTFRKIKEVDPEQNLQTGFIAHEVQAVHPEAVIGEKDAVDEDGNPDYQQVMDAKLTPLMAQAIKELILKNEALEARIAALEAK